MASASEKFHLKRNGSISLRILRSDNDLNDVTLVSDDEIHIEAHKLVLSSSSKFFNSILKKTRSKDPLIYLGGVNSKHLNYILDYIYCGEVQILQEDVEEFLKLSNRLKVDGIYSFSESLNENINPKPFNESFNENMKPKPLPVKVEITDIFDAFNSNEDVGEELKNLIGSGRDENTDLPQNEMDIEDVGENVTEVDGQKPQELPDSAAENKDLQEQEIENEKPIEKVNTFEKIRVLNTEEADYKIKQLTKQIEGGHQCRSCGFKSKFRRSLRNHIEEHLEGLEYPCESCDLVFSTKILLKSHILTCTKRIEKEKETIQEEAKEDQVVELKVTESLGEEVEAKEKSIEEENMEVDVPKEDISQESSSKEDALLEKIKVNNIKEANQYITEFVVKNGKHGESTFNCLICNYSNAIKAVVVKHFDIHFEGIEFSCMFCEFKFKTRNALSVHKYTKHKDKIQNSSSKTEKSISNDDEMKKVDSIEESEKEKGKDENIEIQTDIEIDSSEDRTSCNEGDSETIDISEEKTGPGAIDQKSAVQKIHVSSHEEADKVSKELAERHGDGWKCKHCGRISITKERNKIHILSHLEGVEYSCRYCPKSYSTRNSLHVHTSINHRRE